MLQLTQPVRLIAIAFVPDWKLGGDTGRKYGLILQGECLYILVFRNAEVAQEQQTIFLERDPVELMLHRYYAEDALPAYAHANEQGHLYFREEDEVALSWFAEHFEQFGGEITLVRS